MIKPRSLQQVSRALELEQERNGTLEAELLSVSEELLEVHCLPAQLKPPTCHPLPVLDCYQLSASRERLRCRVALMRLGLLLKLGASCGTASADLQMCGHTTICELLL